MILAKAKKWKFRAFFDPRLLRTTHELKLGNKATAG
jgi:hypothetical protein